MTVRSSRAIETVFLDAGGVLVHPNWARVAEALTRRGVATTTEALTAAEPHAKREMDLATLMARTDDRQRGCIYFESVLRHAGLDASTPAASEALAEVRAYHDVHNVWEHVPADVVPMLRGLRALDVVLVVVSNANGRLHAMFDRVHLTPHVDVILDSHHFGVEKPDPRLFHLALAESGAAAASTMHVGDFFHIDVAGARAAGLAEAVLFDIAALYDHADCPRVHRLEALVDFVAAKNAGA
jgi:putative hydrolase of the HAD superfamily